MSLTSGARIGPYEVTAQIGVGGMGEVYRATDTNLKRQVAIKVLPASVAGDTERLARFQREAEVLAALNHPHIAAIYGLEKAPEFTALVMELVEGEDLSQRIARGVLPIDEALLVAKQIAEALEAAHEQGIIHRDLKPANIKVRADGTVKVLDFGLAKAMEPPGVSSPNVSQAPTMTTPAKMTGVGMILGTAAYMSPEQARGKVVDKRADIWAFGAVLFEMLTGERAFPGEDVADVLAAVVRGEPNWMLLPGNLSPTLVLYIRRCLHKDQTQRIPDIAVMRLALDGAFETPALTQGTRNRIRQGERLAWATALGVVTLVASFAVAGNRSARNTSPDTRVEVVMPATDDLASFAVSPDGRQIVSVGTDGGTPRLWIRSLASSTAQPLPGTESAAYPFWSPDGRSIAFFASGKLKRLDLDSNVPQPIADASARGGTWNADGIIVYTPRIDGPLSSIRASGGQPVQVTTLNRQSSHRFPLFLPGGKQFLFVAQGTADTQGLYLGSLDSPDTYRLTPDANAGAYLSSGWLLWPRNGALIAQSLDLERHALVGDPVPVADSVMLDDFFATALSVSASGLVAYRTGTLSQRQLGWFNRSGESLELLGSADSASLNRPSVSPNSERVAVDRIVQGNTDIWIVDRIRTTRLTLDPALDRFAIWSRDGQRIAFDSNRRGIRDLYQKGSSGAGREDLLVESSQTKVANDWSSDGRFLLYQSNDPSTARDLWVAPVTEARAPWVFLKTRFDERFGQFSPDGQWVTYMSNESGRDEVYVRPFEPTAQMGERTGVQLQISTAGGIHPRWRPDGRELYYIDPAGRMMAAPIITSRQNLTAEVPIALFPTRIFGGGVDKQQGRQYDVAGDGRFLINSVVGNPATPVTLLQNWQPEAKR